MSSASKDILSPGSLAAKDAIAQLTAEHVKVSGLFAGYEQARSPAEKKALVADICKELSVRVQIEEAIFYPEIKAVLKDRLLVPEATIEHATLKSLIAQIEAVETGGGWNASSSAQGWQPARRSC